MIKAIAIDDEPLALKVIEEFCARTPEVELVKTFTKPSEGMKYLKKFPVDLIFLDIKMPSMTGIEFYKQISQEKMVIFTTAYSEYAVEGFELDALDYLLKPFSFERFTKAVAKAVEYFNFTHRSANETNPYFFIRADYSLIKIAYSDVLFIEGLDDYIKIHVSGRAPYVARMTMKSIAETLPANDFVRVHRSFIVPIKKIDVVRNKMIHLGENRIPIGASYEADFMKRYQG
ncbi:MAG TPA: LytTR family DNA-binding domain-containing protein [Bacteroidia bacterium]|jgi:DNA-binding LytR/AlgR family response regulator|nr:LytTR family DNA-binding domain-containing protein [Bacteroidia bacterium]